MTGNVKGQFEVMPGSFRSNDLDYMNVIRYIISIKKSPAPWPGGSVA